MVNGELTLGLRNVYAYGRIRLGYQTPRVLRLAKQVAVKAKRGVAAKEERLLKGVRSDLLPNDHPRRGLTMASYARMVLLGAACRAMREGITAWPPKSIYGR